MLKIKIKDDVDLKKLKKFGFKLNKDKTEYEQYGNELFWNVRTVNVKDRCLGHYIEELNYWNSGKDYELIELVFDDLIKADLVEGIPIPLSNNEKLELLNTINSQSKEIERLNKLLEMTFKKQYPFVVENGIICRKNKEIERLNNIINEIKEVVDDYFAYDYKNESTARLDTINKINNIIVESKGVDSEKTME